VRVILVHMSEANLGPFGLPMVRSRARAGGAGCKLPQRQPGIEHHPCGHRLQTADPQLGVVVSCAHQRERCVARARIALAT